MRSSISVDAPVGDAGWASFIAGLNGGVASELLGSLVNRLRGAGAVSILHETTYIDRDFSAAYSAFYSTLFRPYRKYCDRLHFFGADVSPVGTAPDVATLQSVIEGAQDSYLGSIVLRPLSHAPISSALLSAARLAGQPNQEVTVKSEFATHVLGVELRVTAMPLTQQDTRTGACAQATMWMAGRHFHNRHSSPWFSMPNITEIALKPMDSALARSLPAGSEWLTQDNMVRALRAMGRHPVMYVPDAVIGDALAWNKLSPASIISRYVDSGIPVLLGLQQPGTDIGHGVVAVGVERNPSVDAHSISAGSTTADFLTHILVNDDQRGAYCRLPVGLSQAAGDYPFCLQRDILFLLVPLPGKVFMRAETAEIISRNMLTQASSQRQALAEVALGAGNGWDVDEPFYNAAIANGLVSRTYLTHGWKYKARMLGNSISEEFKAELLSIQLPRFVWVTELGTPSEAVAADPCGRKIRAHVVVDATGSQFGEAPLILDAPGLSLFWMYDPDLSVSRPLPVVHARPDSSPYWPKIRGKMDYSSCTT